MPQARDEAGNIWEVDAQGNAVRLVQAAGMPADPTYAYEGPKAAADARKAGAEADVATATTEAQIRRANAEAAAAQAKANLAIAEAGSGGSNTKGQTKTDEVFAKEYVDWQAAGGSSGLEANLTLLEDALDVIENSDTITGGVFGRLPKFIQQAINPNSQNVKADVEKVIQQSLKQILGAQFAQKEAEQLFARSYDPTQPEASNAARIRSTLNQLRRMGEVRASSMDYFQRNGTLTGWSPPTRSAMDAIRTDGGRTEGLSAAERGATTAAVPYPAEGVAEHDALVARLIAQNNGRLDPQAYAAARAEIDRKYGVQSDPEALATWAGSVNEYLDNGGRTIPTGIQATEEPLSGIDQLRNNAINNPLGAGFVGAVDGATGIPTALAPDQMDALSQSQFPSLLAGQVAGAIGATTGIGAAGRALASKVAPRLLQGGARAQFGRNLATDAAYGAGYTGVSEGDPLSGAAFGALGSAVGQPIGGAIGKAVGGIPVPESVKALAARGIPMTTGQRMGGFAKAVEDRATSIPFIGDMINARRLEGLDAFNRQAFADAGQSIGYVPQQTGKDGVRSLYDAAGSAYDSATQGVQIPLDNQFGADLKQLYQETRGLPTDLGDRFALAMDNRVAPIASAGELTGDTYQQAMRGLKSYKAETTKPGFEQDYRGALSGAMDVLTGQMKRGGGESVVRGLADADAAYRNAKMLENAVQRAKGGSGSGEAYTFTPSQLQMSVQQGQRKYPGATPLEALADAGQDVLPSRIPDSGTAGRVAQMAAPVGAIGAGGAGGYALDGGEGAQTGASAGALASALALLGGTKGGQAAINKMLFERPEVAKRAMEQIAASRNPFLRRGRGLFGSAAVPLTLATQ